MKKVLVLFLAAFSLNASARDCVSISRITNFDAKSPTELHVFTFGRGEYVLTTTYCMDMPFAEQIGFRTFPSNSEYVCEGDDVVVRDRGLGNMEYCLIQKVQKIK
jgi:hypothetical protein